MQLGRCERMVVIAGDDASGEALLPWIGNGFRALGAASIASEASEAALPFDARRNGMLLGAGGIGMVLETEVSGREGGIFISLDIPLFRERGRERGRDFRGVLRCFYFFSLQYLVRVFGNDRYHFYIFVYGE